MSSNLEDKKVKVDALRSEMEGSELCVVVEQCGLTADQTLALRRAMFGAGVTLKVGKNTLTKIAVEGTAFAGLKDMLKGPTALAFSKDPIAAAKVAAEFAKKNDKLKIVGAVMGDKVLDKTATMALATLPSLDELRGKLVGLLVAPATKIARVLQAPAGQLARVMAERSKQAA